MTLRKWLLALGLTALLTSPATAQNNQLRGLPQSGASILPSAQQQLNQNLQNQKSQFSTRQQIQQNNRLQRTQQINRLNNQPDLRRPPCPSTDAACPQNR